MPPPCRFKGTGIYEMPYPPQSWVLAYGSNLLCTATMVPIWLAADISIYATVVLPSVCQVSVRF